MESYTLHPVFRDEDGCQRMRVEPRLGGKALQNVLLEVPHVGFVRNSTEASEIRFKRGIVPDEDFTDLVSTEILIAGGNPIIRKSAEN